ncbi:hypothetical protein HO912_05430 [Streptococcus suis]|nr:hypothetical protein [Streptococcus suis]
MNADQIKDFVSKAKDFVLKNKIAVLSAIGVSVIAVAGYTYYQSQPKSILSAVDVSFEGYDGYGTLSYDSSAIQEEVTRIALKNSGLNNEQVEAVIDNDPIILAEIWEEPKLSKKLTKAYTIVENVDFQFSKTDELKNGEKITFVVKNGSKKSPIKAEKKEFKVEGLQETETISTADFLNEYPVTFQGFNGYGKLVLPEDEYGSYILSTESTEGTDNYKNGDKVKLVVSSEYLSELQSEGKKLESNTVEVEVEGLKEISDITNIADALAKNETLVKSRYENSEYRTYTIEAQKSYIAYLTDYDSSYQVYLVTVYKITDTYKNAFSSTTETTVDYVEYGYRYYVESDNSLDLDTTNEISGYETKDLENLVAELKTEGYKEYTVKAE